MLAGEALAALRPRAAAPGAPHVDVLVWLGAVVLGTVVPPCRASRRQFVVAAATAYRFRAAMGTQPPFFSLLSHSL